MTSSVLSDGTTRLREGLVKGFTRGLTCQQPDDRKQRLFGLSDIGLGTRATPHTGRSRSPPSWRPVP